RRAATRRDARLRMGSVAGLAVRLELEHERSGRGCATRLGLPVRDLGPCAWNLCGTRVVDEVRAAPCTAVVVGLSRRSAASLTGGLRLRFPGCDDRSVLRHLPRTVAMARRGTVRAPNLRLPV